MYNAEVTSAEHTDGTAPNLDALMERLQQELLATGYTYVAGDFSTWPRGHVVMRKEDTYLFVAQWSADFPAYRGWWEHFARDYHQVGMLLVAAESVAPEALSGFLDKAPGAIGCWDTLHGQHWLIQQDAEGYRRPEVLDDDKFAPFLARLTTGDAPRIDCRAALRAHLRHLQRQEPEKTTADTTATSVPWLTYSLIALCALSFLHGLTIAGPSGLGEMSNPALKWGILYGPWVREGEWWRLLTHGFQHANLMHIFFNMLALFYIAPVLEMWQGRKRLLAIFLFSIVAGALLSLLVKPLTPGVGASGGIFGLFGALIAILVRYGRGFDAAARANLVNWLWKTLAMNVVISLLPGISWMAHLGGLLGGFLLTLLIAREPFSRQPLSTPAWLGVLALLTATALAGVWVVMQIPLPQ